MALGGFSCLFVVDLDEFGGVCAAFRAFWLVWLPFLSAGFAEELLLEGEVAEVLLRAVFSFSGHGMASFSARPGVSVNMGSLCAFC